MKKALIALLLLLIIFTGAEGVVSAKDDKEYKDPGVKIINNNRSAMSAFFILILILLPDCEVFQIR